MTFLRATYHCETIQSFESRLRLEIREYDRDEHRLPALRDLLRSADEDLCHNQDDGEPIQIRHVLPKWGDQQEDPRQLL